MKRGKKAKRVQKPKERKKIEEKGNKENLSVRTSWLTHWLNSDNFDIQETRKKVCCALTTNSPNSLSKSTEITATMDILPSGNIFRELQDIHDTGYFSSQVSIEDQWQQASTLTIPFSTTRSNVDDNSSKSIEYLAK